MPRVSKRKREHVTSFYREGDRQDTNEVIGKKYKLNEAMSHGAM